MVSKEIDVLEIAPEDYSDEGLMNLANGIIQKAAADYEQAFLGFYVEGRPPEMVLPELEKWFRSERYQSLTKVDGERLMKMIKLNALEKMIAAYEQALSASRDARLRLLVIMPRHVPNINELIPPMLMNDYKRIMSEQLKTLRQKHAGTKEGRE